METQCPECESIFDVPENFNGREGRCSGCGLSFVIAPADTSPMSSDMPDIDSMLSENPYTQPVAAQPQEPEPAFVAPQVPSTCVTTVQQASSGPVSSEICESPGFVNTVAQTPPEENQVKAKKKKWFKLPSVTEENLPGLRMARILFSIGIGGVVVSYIIFLLALAKDLSLSLNGDVVALKRMIMWICVAMGALFFSLCHLSISAIIKAINTNTMELRKK